MVASRNMAVNVIALLMHSPIPPNGSCQTNKFIQGKVYSVFQGVAAKLQT